MEWTNKMKFFSLIKATPFISTLILILFLSLSNQKENVRLKILIWRTPSLSLGTYLLISTGSGFLLSYVLNTSLVKFKNPQLRRVERNTINSYENKEEKREEVNDYVATYNNIAYDNTLIERDITDPSPTINANFRIISKSNFSSKQPVDTDLDNYADSMVSDSSNYESYEDGNSYKYDNKMDQILSDWEDDSHIKW